MKNFISAMLLLYIMTSCTKQTEQLPDQAAKLSFNMNGKSYQYNDFYEAKQYWSCTLHQYEIEVFNQNTTSFQFFKINITAVDSLLPGNYIMNEVPTNKIAGSCTFWYSGSEGYYTPSHLVMTVASYQEGLLNAVFSGGEITNGRIINLKIV
jgi:hypothetical protein